MHEREIAEKIEKMAGAIAKSLNSGKSIEIHKVNGNTIKFFETKKKIIN